MKKLFTLLMACSLICGQAWSQKTIMDKNAEKRKVSQYHSIQVMHGIDLYLTQSDQEEVAVSASETKYRDNIVTEVRDGVLTISYGDEEHKWWNSGWTNRKLKAYVSIKTLRKLKASGGSDVLVEDIISADDLTVDISGGSDLKAYFSCNLLTLTASGGSDADLKGKATRLRINASGGSDVDAYQLTSDFCTVKSSGGSDVNVHAAKSIDANASGGSDIHYKGAPTETKTNKSGSSDIKRVL